MAGVGYGEARLSVADNGRGVKEDNPKGTGLKLVAALARQIGGTIDQESSKEGTTTCLTFPVITSSARSGPGSALMMPSNCASKSRDTERRRRPNGDLPNAGASGNGWGPKGPIATARERDSSARHGRRSTHAVRGVRGLSRARS